MKGIALAIFSMGMLKVAQDAPSIPTTLWLILGSLVSGLASLYCIMVGI